MADSLDDLRLSLKRLRDDLERLPSARSAPSAAPPSRAAEKPAIDEPAAAPQAETSPASSAPEAWLPAQAGPGEDAISADDELDDRVLSRRRPRDEEARGFSGEGLLRYGVPACLAFILAGVMLDNRWPSGGGLLGLLILSLARLSGSGPAADARLLEIRAELEALEQRMDDLKIGLGSGSMTQALEEEVHELRRILGRLVRSMEESSPSSSIEGDEP